MECKLFKPAAPIRQSGETIEDNLCHHKFKIDASSKVFCMVTRKPCPFAEEQHEILEKRAEIISLEKKKESMVA